MRETVFLRRSGGSGRAIRVSTRSRRRAWPPAPNPEARLLRVCSRFPSLVRSSLALLRFAGLAFTWSAVFIARTAARMRFRLRPGIFFAFSAARSDAAFRQQFEPQCARDGSCFYQTNVDDVTQPVHGAAARSDQRKAYLVVIEILSPQRADRDQAVSAGIAEFDEQSGAGDAGDAALKGCADAVGEKMRDQPVGGFALGLHGAALGDGNLGRDLA